MIRAFVRHLQDLRRAEATVDTYVGMLARLDRTLPEGLAYACADELRAQIYVEGRKPATVALYRAAAKAFFAWATDEHDPWLDYDPSRQLPRARVRQRTPRPCTHEELADILARAQDPCRVWYLLAAGCGLRCVEISRLDRADVTEHVVYILGKGDKERTVPTHPAVWAAIRDLPAGPIARRYYDTARANRRDVQGRGNRHLAVLGHPSVTMHRLRHWYGTYVYQAAGGDLRVVQDLLGHASPNTTQVYVAAAAGAAAAAVRALPLPV
ncbi:site-specific integrase [Micromonospora pallida]|nr:tyrosine-type recombinase/integrase [Micromonospora pallida]